MKNNMFLIITGIISFLTLKGQDINLSSDTIRYKTIEPERNMQTLISGRITHGGYLGMDIRYTEIRGASAMEMGGRIGWIINHCFVIGVGGNGFISDLVIDEQYREVWFDMAGGYGGLLLEPIFLPKSMIHLSMPVIIGAGGVAYNTNKYDNYPLFDNYYDQADAYFMLNPGLEIEINVMRFFRAAIGAYYRWAYDIDMPALKHDVLNGFSGGAALKFGIF